MIMYKFDESGILWQMKQSDEVSKLPLVNSCAEVWETVLADGGLFIAYRICTPQWLGCPSLFLFNPEVDNRELPLKVQVYDGAYACRYNIDVAKFKECVRLFNEHFFPHDVFVATQTPEYDDWIF